MPIALISGPANAGKAELVMAGLRDHLAGGREPALVVPTRADAESYRRELAGENALLGAQVWRFEDLIAEAVRRSGIEGPVLAGIARERLVAALAASEPTLSPRLSPAMAQLFAELHEQRVTPGGLRRALGSSHRNGDSRPAEPALAVAGVYERYEAALREIGRRDEQQRALDALEALRREPARWGARPVLVYGFDDLTPLQLEAICALGGDVGADVTVALTFEAQRAAFAGRAAAFSALLPRAASHRRLEARSDFYAPAARATLGHVERSLFEAPASRPPAGEALQLLEGASERDELELVAMRISELIDSGVDASQIAVVTRAPAASLQLLEDVFCAFGIPHTPAGRRRFGDTAIGAALIGLLRCVDGNGEAEDLLAWLRCPGVLSKPELCDGLEAALLRAGATSAQEARAEWERRHWPLEVIDRLGEAETRGAAELARRAARELAWLFAAPRRGRAQVLAQEEELAEAAALAAGRRALGELAELARAAPDLAPRRARDLAEALAGVELARVNGPAGGAVSVLDPLALRARRVRALFMCGMQEGVFPSARPRARLLGEDERRRLDATVLRRPEGDPLAAERFLLYASASRAEELVVLSWHALREDGAAQARSMFVDEVRNLFATEIAVRRKGPARATAPEAPSEAALNGSAPGPAATPGSGGWPAGAERIVAPSEGIAQLGDPRLLAAMRAHAWSASSLETWISCPVRWLVERALRARELAPDPEPLARGGLAHAVLRQTLADLREQTGSARLTPASLQEARTLLAGALAELEPRVSLSASPERRAGLRRRLRADLERYLEHAARTAEVAVDDAPAEPTHFELEFGLTPAGADGEPGGLPALDIGGGVTLRGRIDRVDVAPGGQAVVYDYKGSGATPAARWLPEGRVQVALYMLATEQLLGLRAAGGFYQPLTGSDLRARGVLDREGGVQLECVGADARDREEVRALLAEAAAAARDAAEQASHGELSPRPDTCTPRGGCAYPTICRCRR